MENKTYNITEPVLIVDDKANIRDTIAQLCSELGLNSQTASNGEEALQMAADGKYSIYIIDLKMPIMDGWTLIPKLKEKLQDPIILIATAINDPNQIIDVMKQGVYDYIIKPVDPELFQMTLKKTMEHIYLKSREIERIKQSEKELQNRLEWLVYKDNRRNQLLEAEGKNVVYNLKTSISQGGGLGNAISIIDMIEALSEKEDKYYKVPVEVLDMLIKNNEISRNTTDGLDLINNILGHEVKLEQIKINQFMESLPETLKSYVEAQDRKGLKLVLPELNTDLSFKIDQKLIVLAIEELLVNAMKYAAENSEVTIYTHITKGFFCLSVMNRLSDNDPASIPADYEKLIIEPFYRHAKPNDEFFDLERFSLGLGLTVVDYIIQKHTGVFFIHQMKDHTQDRPQDCVLAEFQIQTIRE